jgi:hypothetical protein
MPKHANDRALDTVSLRDYFAAAALQALIPILEKDPGDICETAYAYADAMLAERAESPDDAG